MKRHAGTVLAVVLFGLSVCAAGQDKVVDPARVFVTPLRWERMAGAPRSETLRYASGSLAVLYLDGTYAQVAAPFTRLSAKDPVELDLSEGFVLRLGTWARVDDNLIRVQSRVVFRDKLARVCKPNASGGCDPLPEDRLPGPIKTFTCRLEGQSPMLFAKAIYCNGDEQLSLAHPTSAIELDDLPSIVGSRLRAPADKASGTPQAVVR